MRIFLFIVLLTINLLYSCECNSRIAYGYFLINKVLKKEYSLLNNNIKNLDKVIKNNIINVSKENNHLKELIFLEKNKLIKIQHLEFLINKLNHFPSSTIQNKILTIKSKNELYRRNISK